MSYYRECPYCHAHLDPGETCDCRLHKPPGDSSDDEPVEHDYPED